VKVLIIEDNLHPFATINCKLALDKRVSKIGIYDYLSNPVTDDMTYFLDKEDDGHSFELFWVKSYDEFMEMNSDLHSFDLIILDFELEKDNSKEIAYKLIEFDFKGEIIPHSSMNEHNDTLRAILNIDTKDFCKTSGQIAYHMIEQFENKQKSTI